MSPALDYFTNAFTHSHNDRTCCHGVADSRPLDSVCPSHRNVYYNPRLDPANFLEGPLSSNPATRLRQMLARPGIIVRVIFLLVLVANYTCRSLLVSAMVSVRGAHWRPVLLVYIKGQCTSYYSECFIYFDHGHYHISGAATTASRLGQPDLAIATLNDFVEVTAVIFLPPTNFLRYVLL
jgi:hypothetical protein